MSLTRQEGQPRKRPSAKLKQRKEAKVALEAIQAADMATETAQEIMTTEVLLAAVVVPEVLVAEMTSAIAHVAGHTRTIVDHQDMEEAITGETQLKQ